MKSFAETGRQNRLLLIFLGIFILSIAVRIITAEYVDIGGDNTSKWNQALRLVEGYGYSYWYQQTVRWGILLPLAGLIKLFGSSPILMYCQPIFYSSLATGMIYLIGEKLGGNKLGVLSAVCTIIFPQMAQTGSQLWPGVFELCYISICIWLILLWIETRSSKYIILATLILFLGWGCRVSIVYSVPGLLLLIWLPTKDWKALLSCAGLFSLLCALEWLIFWQITGNPLGRLGILASTHLQTAGLEISFVDYILNISKITKLRGLMPIWIFCACAAAYTSITAEDKRWKGFALLYLIHAFLLFYMISKISPLKLAMPVGTRFWGVIAPFGLILLIKTLLDLKKTTVKTSNILLGLLFVSFIGFTLKKIPPNNSIKQLHSDYVLLTPILAAGKPIILDYHHWQPNFIEDFVIRTITHKNVNKTPREDHVLMAISRSHNRMIKLFIPISQQKSCFDENTLTRLSYTAFKFTPPGTSPDTPAGARIDFGRKLHMATRVGS